MSAQRHCAHTRRHWVWTCGRSGVCVVPPGAGARATPGHRGAACAWPHRGAQPGREGGSRRIGGGQGRGGRYIGRGVWKRGVWKRGHSASHIGSGCCDAQPLALAGNAGAQQRASAGPRA
eukprot:25767-Chlamydomonas_euryale.AAC.1